MSKPVYLPSKNKGNSFGILIAVLCFGACIGLLASLGIEKYTREEFSLSTPQPESCSLLAIAFDEAQLAPAWYKSAATELKKCGWESSKVDKFAKEKYCAAMRWNGYEDKDCPDDD